MPLINANDLTLLRTDSKSEIYASFLKPLTLWTARVNSGSLTRGDLAIPFDGGAGSHWSAVEGYQEVWIGTTAGGDEKGSLRIRSVTSGDAGVTGTLNVSSNNVIWADDMYITFKHNYPFMTMYPYINTSEVFFKDRDITYSDQNEEPHPIVVANIWPRAQRLISGEATYWIDVSDSYVVASGAAISTYALSVYPTTGVTQTFNTSTGIGRLVITSSDPDYRWLKFTVTDDNGKSQNSWRCIFIHGEDPDGTNYPHIDFEVGAYSGNWESGGWHIDFKGYANVSLTDIPDKTFAAIWKEREVPGHEITARERVNNYIFVNPTVTYTVVPAAPCTITATFHAGVIKDGLASDGDNISITLNASGGANDTQSANTSSGTLDISGFSLTGADCAGTMTAVYSAITIMSKTYTRGQVVSASAEYPSSLTVFPNELILGYVRREKLSFNEDQGAGEDTIEIVTIDDLMKNEYMFSISLAARPSPSTWYEYESWLTIGRACHHVWKWHSTLLEVADVVGLLDNTDKRAYAEFENGSLYSMPDTMARQHGIRAHVVCNKKGQVYLTQDVQLLIDSDRAALTTIANLTTDDYRFLSLKREPIDRAALVYGSGLEFLETFSVDESGENQPDVEPYCALAPGALPSGEGETVINFERQVLTSQNQLNQLVGRVYAQANNLYPDIRADMSGDYADVLDIHLAEFWEIDVATSSTIKELAIPDLKLIVRDVSAVVSGRSGDIETQVTYEPEQDADPGVETECPGPPTWLGGEIIIIQESALPGAIVTASSVDYLPPDSSAWVQRSAKATEDMLADPYWRIRQSSVASANAILWRCGVGEIERSVDAGQNWSDVTPSSNPPNDAGDTPAPLVGNVTFHMIGSNYYYSGEFTILVNWQNGSSEWRSWIAYTDDDGSTWSWKYLGEETLVTCTNPSMTKYNITGINDFEKFGGMIGVEFITEVDTDKYVVIYAEDTEDLGLGTGTADGAIYVQAFSIDSSTKVITWGTRVRVSAGQDRPFSPGTGQICKVSTDKFVAVYGGWATEGANEDEVMMTTICTLAGLVITKGTSQRVLTADEIALYAPGAASVYTAYPNCPDASTIIIASRHREPTGLCAKPDTAKNQYTLLEGSISGTTITWDDVSCNGDTYRNWIQMESDTGSNANIFNRSVKSGSAHWIWAYEHTDDQDVYVRAGTSTTFGSAVAVPGIPVSLAYVTDLTLITLDTTHAVIVWGDEDSGTSYTDIYANVITRTGTAVSIGSAQLIYSGTVANPDANDFEAITISSTQFAFDCNGADPADDCSSLFRCSVSGNTITLLDNCIKHKDPFPWAIGYDSAYYIAITDWDYSGSATPYATTFRHTPVPCSSGTGDAKGLGVQVGRGAGGKAWITIADGSDMELLELSLPSLSIAQRIGLGSATYTQVDDRTYFAFPRCDWLDDDEFYIAGRFVNPTSTNTEHIMGTAYGGASWITVEDDWGTDHCGAMVVMSNGAVYAMRNDGSRTKLYVGDAAGVALKSTSALEAEVNQNAMVVDHYDGMVIIGADIGSTYMVVASVSPYLDWYDLTSNHQTANGINAIELL